VISFSERTPKQCAYIDGDPADLGATTCCGKKVVSPGSWCKKHREKVFMNQKHAKALTEMVARVGRGPRNFHYGVG